MFSDKARPAMTTLTRGQNSWVNFSGANDESNQLFKEARNLRKAGKHSEAKAISTKAIDSFKFAEQKLGFLPDKFNRILEKRSTKIGGIIAGTQYSGMTVAEILNTPKGREFLRKAGYFN